MGYSANTSSFFKTTRRISLGLGGLKFVRALLTVYSVVLSAKYFGASLERDSWIIAGTAVTVLTQIMFGPINEIFRTKFIHVRAEEGEEKALLSTSSLIFAIIGICLIIIALIEVFPGLMSSFFAPGFNSSEQKILSQMIRWLMPTLLLNEITLIWIAVLNAYHSYFIPDIYSLIAIVINLVCIIALVPFIGIYSLIVANYIGTSVLAVVLISALIRHEKKILFWSFPSWSLIRPFIVTSFPFYIAFLAGNVQLALERMLSTYLGVGNVSVLDYARKFIDMPTSVVVGIISTVLAPTLAEHFIRNKQGEFHRETIKFIRMLVLVLIPFVVLFSVCSREMVELLLAHGSFKREFIGVTAESLAIFCFGAVGYIMYAVGAQALIAQKKAALYAIVGSVATTVSIALNLSLFKLAGLLIFPFSWGLTLFLSGLYMIFQQKHNRLDIFKEICKMLGMLILIIAISYAVRIFSVHILYETVKNLKTHDLLVVLTTVLIGNSLYIWIMYIFNIEEIQGIKRYISGKTDAIFTAN